MEESIQVLESTIWPCDFESQFHQIGNADANNTYFTKLLQDQVCESLF